MPAAMLTPALASALLLGAFVSPDQSGETAEPTDRAPLLAPRPARRGLSERQIAAAVENLAADDWATREAASRLLEHTPAAAGALRAAAFDDDPERRTRAVAALSEGVQKAVRRGDLPAAAAFVEALNALWNADDPGSDDPGSPDAATPAGATARVEAAASAEAALGLFPTTVTPLAIAEVRRQGAAVMRTDLLNRGFGPAFGGGNRPAWSITLDDRWTGGEAGLRYLRLIDNLRQVHLTDDCPIPENARRGLIAREYGTFAVERRGKAFLGVSFSTGGAGGCQIESVTAGGPASRAGLRPGDVIVRFGETPINTPAALLDAIREEGTVDEATPVTVLRPGRPRAVIPVTLSRWPDRPLTDPNAPDPRFPFRPQPLPGLAPPGFAPPRPPGGFVPPAGPPGGLPPVPDFDPPFDPGFGDDPPVPRPPGEPPFGEPPFGPDRPAERFPGNGEPADLGDTED